MPFHSMTEMERREVCMAAIHSLEVWLRRVIDHVLRAKYGSDYLDAIDPKSGLRVFKKKRVAKLKERAAKEPDRFNRPIDAAMLEDEIDIVCNQDHFNSAFRPFFDHLFPIGRAHLRDTLKRLVAPRNALYHANPVSVRQAEQIICYSHDVIDSIKHQFQAINMNRHFNVPTILRITDSHGGNYEIGGTVTVDCRDQGCPDLMVGETLSIDAEIDPSFPADDYTVEWTYREANLKIHKGEGNRFSVELDNRHVHDNFKVFCTVTSTKSWHRHGHYDHSVILSYRVLPEQM